jgi:hypothetical protein
VNFIFNISIVPPRYVWLLACLLLVIVLLPTPAGVGEVHGPEVTSESRERTCVTRQAVRTCEEETHRRYREPLTQGPTR